ncbi:hypothetical protein [Pelagerythrobacter sp.]|uniref:hypothetical protein n=1 Tax=Pelagerythrobacter sp. TaxID=2800702 RepID=UPI0035B455EE
MLTRLLACLALITGLAAAGTPASAAYAQALSAQVGDSATETQPGKAQRCDAAARKGRVPAKADPARECRPRKPVVIYIPTVQFGPDRAFE